MTRLHRVALVLLLAGAAVCEAASDATALDGYLAGLSTWSANFTQSVVDAKGKPAAGGHARGRLLIVRPGKFRLESAPDGASDGAQLQVADGRNLWSLDRDLNEATVTPLAEALRGSPTMLLTGGAELRSAFNVRDDGRRDGLDWVRAQPTDVASDFREAQFGFKGKELARLIIVDKLGQRSTLVFTDVKRNAPVEPGATEFQLPPGADLIGKPVAP